MTRSALAWARAAYAVRTLGTAGWCGVASLSMAAVIAFAALPVMERAGDDRAGEIRSLERQREAARDPAASRNAADSLAAFVAGLPAENEIADFVAAVQQRADHDAVQIDSTEYRIQPLLGHSVQRYRLSFPAHVDYPHLRAWLQALLHDYPGLVLDEINLRREVDGGEELEAHVGLSFLAREGR